MASFKEMPQPRTFAPSKEDVLQNLQYFFGAPVSPEKLKVRLTRTHALTRAKCSHAPCSCSGLLGASRHDLCAAIFELVARD